VRFFRFIALLTSCTLVGSVQAQAAAMPETKGQWFLAPQVSYYSTSRYWDINGVGRPLGSYAPFIKRELSLYGEYGLTANTTLTFNTAYDVLTQPSPAGPLQGSGFTQFDIGLIHALLRDQHYALSLYGWALLPNGRAPDSQGLLVGYDRAGVEGGILAGAYYDSGYVDAGVGYRWYFGYPSNQIRAYVNGGLTFAPGWQILGGLSGTFGTNRNATFSVGSIVSQPYYQLAQASIGLRYRILPGVSVVPMAYFPFWGRNTGQGSTLSMSLWLNF